MLLFINELNFLQECGPERPDVKDELVADVLKDFYGLKLLSVTKLPGYDDFTALVEYNDLSEEETEIQKAVIKILGADSSSKVSYQKFLGKSRLKM